MNVHVPYYAVSYTLCCCLGKLTTPLVDLLMANLDASMGLRQAGPPRDGDRTPSLPIVISPLSLLLD